MRFLMLVATDSDPDSIAEQPGEIDAWFDAVNGRGQWVTGDRLRPAANATTVRVRSGEVLVTDGSAAGAKDRIVGFDVLDCDSLADAIDLAAMHPMARGGRLELRPCWPFEG